jgi:MSHA pilin protein MshC
MNKAGFTLVELIVVIVIVGIVALIAAPRFFAQAGFSAASFHDTAISAVRYAHKLAQAQRTPVFVVSDGARVALCYEAACAGRVQDPTDGAPFIVVAPTGIAIANTNFSFNSLGQPSAAQSIAISGDTRARQIVVERETGYAHP